MIKYRNKIKTYVKIIALFYVTILFSNNSLAQESKLYSSDNVISSNLINSIYQDKEGYIWIATHDGLNKMNENGVIKYSHIAGDSLSLSSNYVRALFEDSKSRFWVGQIHGLQKYDRAYDCFRDVVILNNKNRIYPHITSIIETGNHDIWFGTSGSGLIILPHEETLDTLYVRNNSFFNQDFSFIQKLYIDFNQNIWIATNKQLLKYSSITGKINEIIGNDNHSISNVFEMQSDNDGNIYIATISNGLYIKYQDNESYQAYCINELKNINFQCLEYIPEHNEILLGSDGYGLYTYDVFHKKILRQKMINGTIPNEKNKIHCILRDRDNNIWMGIYQKGVLFIPKKTYNFDYYGKNSIDKNIIGSYCVTSLYMSDNNTLWVGTDNDGLYKVNLKDNTSKHYMGISNKYRFPNTIMDINSIGDGILILSSYFNGISYFDINSSKINFKNPLPNTCKCISSTAFDDDGNLWIGTLGNGMYGINRKTNKIFQHLDNIYNTPKYPLLSNRINYITKDNNGILWIGTSEGLNTYNPKNGTFPYEFTNTILRNCKIKNIMIDDNKVWIGTDCGLYNYDIKTKKVKYLSKGWSNAESLICAIEKGNDGDIWFSTHSGLYSYNIKQQSLSLYTKADGIQGNEFFQNAATKAKDGKLFFAGVNGITSFYPKDIKPREYNLKLSIESLNVNGRNIKMGDKSGNRTILDTALIKAHNIHLSYNDNSFTIKFSNFNYINSDRIRLLYRFASQNTIWTETSLGNKTISIIGLKYGKYILEAKMQDHNIISDIYRINVFIHPPWYATIMAKIVWILIILGNLSLIFFYIRNKYRRQQNNIELAHKQELQEAKLQYFTDISHEIRTPITLILTPLEQLMKRASDNKRIYEVMYHNGQMILKLINQLIDIRKLERKQIRLNYSKVNLVTFINNILDSFSYDLETHGIDLILEKDSNEIFLWIDINQFDKIIINIIANAFKYTPEIGGVIKISIKCKSKTISFPDGYAEIIVQDNGPGIPERKLKSIFDRFYQVDNNSKGTGIGLHLANQMVKLHHGDIAASNAKSGGAIFTIRMPLGERYLTNENTLDSVSTQVELDKNKTSKIAIQSRDFEEKDTTVEIKKGYLIYIAEDNTAIRNYLIYSLQDTYKVKGFENGLLLNNALKDKPANLVISDVLMPEMDGETLCKQIKKNPDLCSIPVILLTAKTLDSDYINGLESGADAYIMKPFNLDVLKATIKNKLINHKRLNNASSTKELIKNHIADIKVKSADDELEERVMKVINTHLSDASLTVENLALEVGISRAHLHRKLKNLTNLTPSELIWEVRLQQSAELLKDKHISVSDAAYATGFVNLAHFSTKFKNKFGVAPSHYAENK